MRRLLVLFTLVISACGPNATGLPPSTTEFALPAYAPDVPSGVALECQPVALNGILQGAATDPDVAWLQVGADRVPLVWPEGYRARFVPRLEVIDASNRVVLYAGDKVTTGCATGLHNTVWLMPPFNP